MMNVTCSFVSVTEWRPNVLPSLPTIPQTTTCPAGPAALLRQGHSPHHHSMLAPWLRSSSSSSQHYRVVFQIDHWKQSMPALFLSDTRAQWCFFAFKGNFGKQSTTLSLSLTLTLSQTWDWAVCPQWYLLGSTTWKAPFRVKKTNGPDASTHWLLNNYHSQEDDENVHIMFMNRKTW